MTQPYNALYGPPQAPVDNALYQQAQQPAPNALSGFGDFLHRNFVDATVPLSSDENEWAQEMMGQRELRRNDARYQGKVMAKSITDGLESVGRGLSSINDYTPGALLKKAAEKYGTAGPIEPVPQPTQQQDDQGVISILRRYGLAD